MSLFHKKVLCLVLRFLTNIKNKTVSRESVILNMNEVFKLCSNVNMVHLATFCKHSKEAKTVIAGFHFERFKIVFKTFFIYKINFITMGGAAIFHDRFGAASNFNPRNEKSPLTLIPIFDFFIRIFFLFFIAGILFNALRDICGCDQMILLVDVDGGLKQIKTDK